MTDDLVARSPEAKASDLRPGWWMTAEWWPDDDGEHVWFAHDCETERVETMLPHPTWSMVVGERGGFDVAPSVDCRACGLHTFLLDIDRRGSDV